MSSQQQTPDHAAVSGGGGGAAPPPPPPPPPPPAGGGAALGGGGAAPLPSRRVVRTARPVVGWTKAVISASGRPDIASLAQGVVHYPPPRAALRAAAAATAAAACDPSGGAARALSSYGATPGHPALRAALKRHLARAHGLDGYVPVVTPGANAAFTIALLALCDAGDGVALFRPLYFNHAMSVTMTSGVVLEAPMRPDLRPDLDWLEALVKQQQQQQQQSGGGSGGSLTAAAAVSPASAAASAASAAASAAAPPAPLKAVVLCNPCNPTGVLLTRGELDRAAALAAAARAWLIVDNTYADFVYGGRAHYCPSGPHVVHTFSFSKAYGMHGWRVGYIALPPPPLPLPPPPPAAAAVTTPTAEPAVAGDEAEAAAEAAAAAAAARVAEDLGDGGELMALFLKVQDSIPIHVAQVSQLAALAALEGAADFDGSCTTSTSSGGGDGDNNHDDGPAYGPAYVRARVAELEATNREYVRDALAAALGGAAAVGGGEGAIYFFARLPPEFAARDADVVRALVAHAGVCVLPGSACGAPGWLRVCFANLEPAACRGAAARLRDGLIDVVRRGPAALDELPPGPPLL